MVEIERQLKIAPLLARKSFFLFGPRATGKSTLIRQQLAGLILQNLPTTARCPLPL